MLETNDLFRQTALENDSLYMLTQDDIQAIQKVLLEQMEDFHYVCQKYGLQYAMVGGTALGAVRHKGFIPWDEDLDVCMPRRDYDRFQKLFEKEFGDKYWVQSVKTNPKYDLNFMKIRKKGTRYVEIFEPDMQQAGIFIDIFCVENTYNNSLLRRLQGMIVNGLLLCVSCVRIYNKKDRLLAYMPESSKKAVQMIKLKAAIGKMLSFRSITRWCLSIEKWAGKCKNDTSKYITVPAGRKHFFGEIYERDVFFPAKKAEFEGRQFYIVGDAHVYLTKFFGNYMEIPPVDKRERHSIIEFRLQ